MIVIERPSLHIEVEKTDRPELHKEYRLCTFLSDREDLPSDTLDPEAEVIFRTPVYLFEVDGEKVLSVFEDACAAESTFCGEACVTKETLKKRGYDNDNALCYIRGLLEADLAFFTHGLNARLYRVGVTVNGEDYMRDAVFHQNHIETVLNVVCIKHGENPLSLEERNKLR
ncbi:MAG: hypothetical protein IJV70_07145 [Clostridia bacterium]|nr:hypothetical protein [Clostridia bacterium]